jgi:hypothetical protein
MARRSQWSACAGRSQTTRHQVRLLRAVLRLWYDDHRGGTDEPGVSRDRVGPAYADVAVLRWQAFTGSDAVLEATRQTFADVKSVTGSVA